MPSFVTHNIFAKELRDKSSNESLKKIINNNINIYLMAAQSFDLLKFSIKNHKNCVNLCKTSHRINVNSYFINLINEAKTKKNEELNAFILGSLTHQILDSNLHPYIVYKTGIVNGKKETNKYIGLHTLMETRFDMFNYQRYYAKVLINANLKKEFFPKLNVSNNTINSINEVYNKMYQIDGGTYQFAGYNTARKYINLIRKPNILNKIFYSFKSNLKPYLFNKKNISYDYLNINHNTWCYPSDKTIKKKDSLIDLYNNSLIDGIKILNTCYKILYEEEDINKLLKLIGNKGYVRGTDCNTLKPIKYFEF